MNKRHLRAGMLLAAGVVALSLQPVATAKDCSQTHYDYTVTATPQNSCTGDQMNVTLTVHENYQTCTDPDGTVTVKHHAEVHGKGVGVPSGTEYVFQQVGMDRTYYSSAGQCAGATFSTTVRTHAISKGRAPNEFIDVVLTGKLISDPDHPGQCIADQSSLNFQVANTSCRGGRQ